MDIFVVVVAFAGAGEYLRCFFFVRLSLDSALSPLITEMLISLFSFLCVCVCAKNKHENGC